LDDRHPDAAVNAAHIERMVKFLLWSRADTGCISPVPPQPAKLEAPLREDPTGRFDAT
jgi:hypothetical protein